jgi:hypothetical protein
MIGRRRETPRALLSALLTGVAMVTAANTSAGATSDTEMVKLGGREFQIPARYLQAAGEPPAWLQALPGFSSAKANERELLIDAPDVAAGVPGYKQWDGRYEDSMLVRLVVLTEQERHQYAASARFSDIWNSSGSYHDRIIEQDAKTGFFRVYRKIDYPNSWEVFTVSPALSPMPRDVFSFWLGRCFNLHSPLTQSGEIVDCNSYALAGNVAANFHTMGQNIPRIPRIRAYLAGLIYRWQKRDE